jgi:hypothetical protein
MVILNARRFLGYRGGDRFDRRRRLHDRSKTGYCYEMTPERDDLTVVEQRILALWLMWWLGFNLSVASPQSHAALSDMAQHFRIKLIPILSISCHVGD